MPVRKNTLKDAEALIRETLRRQPRWAFTRNELFALLQVHDEAWRLLANITPMRFVNYLVQAGLLRPVEFLPEGPGKRIERLALDGVSPFGLGLSLAKSSYLSHGSAVYLQGLSDELPKTLYVNVEQSAKPEPDEPEIDQAAIDRAFASPQRTSNLAYTAADYRFVRLSGKHTGRQEVGQLQLASGEVVDVTKLERTLIDIAVRPDYAGGVHEVREAYVRARERMSVATLLVTLKQLAYLYPYHQAIGFYLERAGYPESQWGRAAALGATHDFYLAHGLKETRFDARWRIHYPAGL